MTNILLIIPVSLPLLRLEFFFRCPQTLSLFPLFLEALWKLQWLPAQSGTASFARHSIYVVQFLLWLCTDFLWSGYWMCLLLLKGSRPNSHDTAWMTSFKRAYNAQTGKERKCFEQVSKLSYGCRALIFGWGALWQPPLNTACACWLHTESISDFEKSWKRVLQGPF